MRACSARVLGALGRQRDDRLSRSSHIIGPAVFSVTYMKTVATVPGTFYLVCCAALVAALVLLMFIRLRGHAHAAAVVDADGERVGAPAAEGTAAVSR